MTPALPLLLLSLSQTGTATATDDLTTDVRAEQEPPLDLGRFLLNLPGAFIELAFVPLMPVALVFEQWHVHQRLFDLVTNDEQTLAVLPLIAPFNRSGTGFGLAVVHNDPLGSQDRTVLFGLVRTNSDIEASVSLSRRIPQLSGRVVSLGAKYGVDRDTRFFGLGGGGDKDLVRLIRTDAIDLTGGIDVFSPLAQDFNARIDVAYRRRALSNGSGGDPGILSDALFTPPPGFGASLDYPELTLELSWDTRDSAARTTKGVIASIESSITHDVNGGNTGGVRTTAAIGTFFELLPLYRVLHLSAGVSAAVPLRGEDEIPLHHLINLGGSSSLRGYPSDRFIDRLGWWASAEYRYHFFEYAATGYGLSASLFGDVGRVGRNPSDLIKSPIAWSFGFGVRIEHNLLLLARIQLGIGPEGARVSLGFGEGI
jgi:hypothetical protein